MSRKSSRSRPRDSIEAEEDDHALDAMLVELGIPLDNNAQKDDDIQVIELITPPRKSPPIKKRKQSSGPSFVDLTTSPSLSCLSHEQADAEDEVSFCVCVSPPFVSCPVSSDTENSSSLKVVSPLLLATTRQQVFTVEITQAEAKQARRLSGSLKELHLETTKSREMETDRAISTSSADPSGAKTTGRSKTRKLSSRLRTACGKDRGGAAAVVAVVQMEQSLDTSEAGESIRDALKNHVYNGKPVPFTVTTALNCILPGVIRWERRGSGTSYYSCAIYYKADVYLKVLEKRSYMELVAAVQYLQTLIPKTQLRVGKSRQPEEEQEPSKFFIIVEGMNRGLIELKKRQQQKKGSSMVETLSMNLPMITFADLHEVAFQLFMDVGAHTKFTSDLDATANYIALLTRELVIASSRVSALEEFLEAVPRYNSFRVTHTGTTSSACANAWLRMLQVIPGVSEDKAQCLLDHFPTFDSLMQAYRDPGLSRAQKQDLVADKLHDARIQRALSKRIYTVFSEKKPDSFI